MLANTKMVWRVMMVSVFKMKTVKEMMKIKETVLDCTVKSEEEKKI